MITLVFRPKTTQKMGIGHIFSDSLQNPLYSTIFHKLTITFFGLIIYPHILDYVRYSV